MEVGARGMAGGIARSMRGCRDRLNRAGTEGDGGCLMGFTPSLAVSSHFSRLSFSSQLLFSSHTSSFPLDICPQNGIPRTQKHSSGVTEYPIFLSLLYLFLSDCSEASRAGNELSAPYTQNCKTYVASSFSVAHGAIQLYTLLSSLPPSQLSPQCIRLE